MRATKETTGGAFGIIEHLTMPARFASPYHTHQQEDEAFYVLEGRLAFVCGGEWTTAGPGTYVFGAATYRIDIHGPLPARPDESRS